MNTGVEVVVLHYKRPANIARILRAFREGTTPVKLTLIDAHPPGFELDPGALELANNVINLKENLGSFNRYVPGFGYGENYTYFHDDDMLPGRRLIEHFVRHAGQMEDFGMLGQAGRRSPGGSYKPHGVERSRHAFTAVDSVIQGYFVQTRHLHHVLRLKSQMQWDVMIEDDLLAAYAMRLYGNLPVLLTPLPKHPEEKMNVRGLASPHALSHRRNHLHRRSQFLRQIRELGWRSVLDEDGSQFCVHPVMKEEPPQEATLDSWSSQRDSAEMTYNS